MNIFQRFAKGVRNIAQTIGARIRGVRNKPPKVSAKTPNRADIERQLQAEQERVNNMVDAYEDRYSEEEFTAPGSSNPISKVGDQRIARPRFRYNRTVDSFADDQAAYDYLLRLKGLTIEQFQRYDEIWKQNVCAAIYQVHGEAGQDLISWIESMPVERFARIMITKGISIEYIYTPEDRAAALEELEIIFGLES